MLEELFSNDIFAPALVFARIGAAMMLLPGFSESYVTPRVRLLFALALTIVITPVVGQTLPAQPESIIESAALIIGEIVIGLFFGGLARLMVSTLHIAGTIIGFQTSLGNATLFDPSNAQQGSMIGAFLNIIGVFLIFMSDLHHLMLSALAGTYWVFVPGAPLPFGEFSDMAARLLAQSFTLGMQIAAPFVVIGLVFYIGLGLLARLMPQVQVFFIAIPIQIMLGFLVMSLTLSAAMMWFLGNFQNTLLGFLGT